MKETLEYLTKISSTYYLATSVNNIPNVRPFGSAYEFNNKIYMMTNKKKNVSKEIAQNNRVCITACEGGNWMRIDCNLIDDSDNKEAKQKA